MARDRGIVPEQINRPQRDRNIQEVRAVVSDDLIRQISVAIARIPRLGRAPIASACHQENGLSATTDFAAMVGADRQLTCCFAFALVFE